MEKLSRLAQRYVPGWPGRAKALQEEARLRRLQLEREELERRRSQLDVGEAAKNLLATFESLLLWENPYNSTTIVIAFNILFWGFVVLEVRGIAAASSAALVIVFCYSTLETHDEEASSFQTPFSKAEQVEKLVKKAKSTFDNIVQMQQEQPRAFCTAVCTVSLALWAIARHVDSVLITYAICMSIFMGPAILLRSPSGELQYKEWDSEIDDFLPAVTEDNLLVLRRAGDTGDRSPTPPTSNSTSPDDQYNDEDLVGLKMPSHEEGSADDLDLSELELSAGETDTDGIRFQSLHFERGSSSSDEDAADLGIVGKSQFDDVDGDSDDSEFEIIDQKEVVHLMSI
ncbi:hypothetical protein QAD02_019027 [Eretmocerus hayati]|uniref:Uncharacterized protein n=1 Tax=Eretmocerus hayati TaxID=131215 RepID=A0ACC2PN69_9HYME|nr:hypothetical protein QAD02_019027 [Eretmocerus hayati]